ncbi:sulfate permease [uncultured Albimonas sp.]|uniref:SulP family inorganic anion transporter n=1 Tax=uncultured Albimonas sp. TaxID=1331701 RepID=UPI0030EBA501|tara:strand:- start:4790 stop:6550 length:1761 start_codon:yes stop_codon:yes gene_type:complete
MLKRCLPILEWGARYDRETFGGDLMAAVIVTIMLIPQSLAYAMIAGLPPEVGLYASIAPLVLYAVFGTSRALAVGPVAVVSLMTATAVGQVAEVGTPEYYGAAMALALLSGLMLVAMGALKLGFLANFLSHPVVAGFITASGVIIAASQVKHVLGVEVAGGSLPETVWGLAQAIPSANAITFAIGAAAAGFLFWARRSLKPLLIARGVGPRLADALAKAGPVAAVAVTTLLSWGFDLSGRGVAIVGDVPSGLPSLSAPPLDLGLWTSLLGSALLISVIGFVESVSVAQTLAAKRRQRIRPDQELIGLGAANLGAAFTGGYPVTGGFARSVVNFDAGAQTPAAGAFTAGGIALATLFLTPLLHFLPVATLAATIIVAVLSLVDFGSIRRTWVYSRPDALAAMATIGLTWLLGVEAGVIAGVSVSIGLHLWRTSQPHCAIVGQVPGTEHFRNVDRHHVVTAPDLTTLRVDESLWFPNARFLEDKLLDLVAGDCVLRDIVLMCPAVNSIDASALESLEEINRRLKDAGVTLHLSEVKGPVMDRLKKTHFLDELTGRVFLTQFDAIQALRPEIAAAALRSPRCETAKAVG